MKLLFDQNLSYRLKNFLLSEFPGSEHVASLGFICSADSEIWNYAKENNFTIVTQDADYYEMALLRGIPPKIIWVRSGNTSTHNLQKIFSEKISAIKEFLREDESICLELH